MVPARSPKVIPRSTTSPSIWLNTGRWRASGVSRRKHLPGITAWIGRESSRTAASIRWICTGEVCVRSSTVSGSPMSRYMVSYMPRAGWAGGMFSASKLYQSVSASGPSATVKPMPTKTSSSSARAWVTRCRCPRAGGDAHLVRDDLGQVEAVGQQRLGPLGLAASSARRAARRASSVPAPSFEAAAGLLAGLGVEAAQGAVGPGQRRALAQELDLDLGQRRRSRPRPRWPARRRR